MKITPIETVITPNYPDKYSPEAKKALSSAMPKRWLKAPLAISLSAAVAVGFSGCRYATDGDGPSPAYPNGTEAGDFSEISETTAFTTGDETLILGNPAPAFIPLFEYGEGTGAIGCVSVAAPSFMSEEEAFAVLAAAFEEAGLTLNRNSVTLEDVNLPVTDLLYTPGENKTFKTKNGVLNADMCLTDGSLQIPVEFVSRNDIDAWQGESEVMSTVSSYDTKSAARVLAENNAGIAVFYDPCVLADYNEVYSIENDIREGESEEEYQARLKIISDQITKNAREETERLLKQQAEAFADWLHLSGVL